jgi:hypothetical protein
LVDLVINKGLSIAKAARRLFIKSSTAKLIVKRFRLTGTYHIISPPVVIQPTLPPPPELPQIQTYPEALPTQENPLPFGDNQLEHGFRVEEFPEGISSSGNFILAVPCYFLKPIW